MTVYFAQQTDGDNRMVKIGYSAEVGARLASLKTGSAVPIDIVATLDGGKETEALIHRQLESSRQHGEWFKPTDEVMALIEAVNSASFQAKPAYFKKHEKSNDDSAIEDLRIATELLGLAMGPIVGRMTIGRAMELLLPKLQAINPAWSLRRLKSIQSQETTNIKLWIVRDLIAVVNAGRVDSSGNNGD